VPEGSTAFAERLESVRLSQAEFRRLVQRLSGIELDRATTSHWVTGQREPHACALAFLAVIAEIPPSQLAEILKKHPLAP